MAKSKFQKKYGRSSFKKRRFARTRRTGLKRPSKSLKRAIKSVVRASTQEHLSTNTELGHEGYIYPNVGLVYTAGLGNGFFAPLSQAFFVGTTSNNRTISGITGRQYEVDSMSITFRIRWKPSANTNHQVMRARFCMIGARSKGALDLLSDFSDYGQTWYKPNDSDYMIQNTKIAHSNVPILAERRFDLVSPLNNPGSGQPSYNYQNYTYSHKFTRPWRVTLENNSDGADFNSVSKGAILCWIMLEYAVPFISDHNIEHITTTARYRDI